MRVEHPSLRQGLVGAWCPSLGASGLTLIDRSGRNKHGTLTNMAGQDNWQARGSGVAINFDGSNDYVSASVDASYQTGSFSFSWWIRRSGNVTQNYPGVVCHSNLLNAGNRLAGPCVLLIPSSGGSIANRLYFQCQNATQDCSVFEAVAGNDGLFHAYCGVIDSSSAALYKDGLFQESAPSVTRASVTRALEIGRRSGDTTGTAFEYFSGQIDDLRIYNRVLTLAEIRLLASRRGIGLQPLPDRAAGMPRKLSINVGGTWRAADAYVNVGGMWKLAQASTNVAGVWK